MRLRPFGPRQVPVPVLGQGTWRVQDAVRASSAIVRGIELGMTHIDTAELYENQSRSETMLRYVLQGRRDQIYLASKVLPQNASSTGTAVACKASLARLATDYLDMYYLHWRGEHPLRDTMRAMAELLDAGLVRDIGVSNFDVDDLEETLDVLGKHKLAANQVLYHLEDRGAESEVIPWCKAQGVAVVAYSPFGAGRFVTSPNRMKVLEETARSLRKTARQVALAFLAREPHVFPIPKAESRAHVEENAGSDFDLPREAVDRLDSAFPVRSGLRSI